VRILTDPRGERLDAEREVEATLLPPSAGSGASGVPGLFRAEQAVHFVAERLEAEQGGSTLVFTGGVRGWQGAQNLSAERVSVRQSDSALSASDNVNTRFPREDAGDSAAEASYVQISSERLQYDDGQRRATYEGNVRIRLAEGWLEAARVELDLHTDDHGIREIRAFDTVRMEFRDPAEPERPQIVAGRADRLRYNPADATVWLYGEQQPASVRRVGQGEGTTTGRVLRYRLDTGTLDVDSGEQAPAQIRTSDG
jgi:lipopolysaccharide transport protein LptA